VTRGQLPQRAVSLGLNGGEAAVLCLSNAAKKSFSVANLQLQLADVLSNWPKTVPRVVSSEMQSQDKTLRMRPAVGDRGQDQFLQIKAKTEGKRFKLNNKCQLMSDNVS